MCPLSVVPCRNQAMRKKLILYFKRRNHARKQWVSHPVAPTLPGEPGTLWLCRCLGPECPGCEGKLRTGRETGRDRSHLRGAGGSRLGCPREAGAGRGPGLSSPCPARAGRAEHWPGRPVHCCQKTHCTLSRWKGRGSWSRPGVGCELADGRELPQKGAWPSRQWLRQRDGCQLLRPAWRASGREPARLGYKVAVSIVGRVGLSDGGAITC